VIEPIARPRDAVYATLKRRILLNEDPPEAALTELGLAQRLGCSQGTVREALLRLQEDGLVLRAGRRGTTVTPLDAASAAEMLALRRHLETRGAARAWSARADGLRDRLEQVQIAMEQAAAAGDSYGVIELDTRFHMTLFQAAEWPALDQILLRAILNSHRHKLWAPSHRRPLVETAARHRVVLAALAAGPGDLATALGRHIDTIVDVLPERLAS
jgi:DNA-binding GntR family transcriptional regulator